MHLYFVKLQSLTSSRNSLILKKRLRHSCARQDRKWTLPWGSLSPSHIHTLLLTNSFQLCTPGYSSVSEMFSSLRDVRLKCFIQFLSVPFVLYVVSISPFEVMVFSHYTITKCSEFQPKNWTISNYYIPSIIFQDSPRTDQLLNGKVGILIEHWSQDL
jgi:hypothetical protein